VAHRLTVTPEEAADRLAIRELIDAYAHCADRRDAGGQMALFTEDTRFVVFMDSRDPNPSQTIVGRHFNGQSTVDLNGAVATGESYCIAHHIQAGKARSLMVASIRYLDEFLKENGRWLFSERRLMVDWVETSPLGS
jgi:SnoaL-like domain